MINLQQEKNLTLTPQNIYDILTQAQIAAKDDFFNSYIFSRAVLVFAAQILYPEQVELVSNILTVYTNLLMDGTLEHMTKEYAEDIEFLNRIAQDWYEEAAENLCSPRGLLDGLNNFSGNVLEELMKQFQEVTSDENIQALEEFTKKWA